MFNLCLVRAKRVPEVSIRVACKQSLISHRHDGKWDAEILPEIYEALKRCP